LFRVEGRRRRHPQARPDESGESCGRHQSAHHQRREVTSSSSWRPSSVQPSWQLSSWPRYVLRKKIGKCLVSRHKSASLTCLLPYAALSFARGEKFGDIPSVVYLLTSGSKLLGVYRAMVTSIVHSIALIQILRFAAASSRGNARAGAKLFGILFRAAPARAARTDSHDARRTRRHAPNFKRSSSRESK
jgi:hypothetical protein